MNAGRIDTEIARLPAVTLDELGATAALLTRRDRKYIVPEAVAAELIARLPESSRALEIEGRRRFGYESVYFDTPSRASYLAAARRRPRRLKVRTRAYLDTGRCLVEIKTRDGRGRTVKEQHDLPAAMRADLGPTGRDFATRCPLIGAAQSRELEPTLTTRYDRRTLLVGDGLARMTIDTAVRAETPDGRSVTLPGQAIIETKSAGGPGPADRVLWSMGFRPIRISKYATSLAALCPELPSNRWTRALRHPWVLVPGDGLAPVPSAEALLLAG